MPTATTETLTLAGSPPRDASTPARMQYRSPAKSLTRAQTWREDQGVAVLVPVHYCEDEAALPVFSPAEVAQHASRDDCWFVIHGLIYDGSRFAKSHPGGWLPMNQFAGKTDCSDAFEAFHPARVHRNLLQSLLIGRLQEQPAHVEDAIEVACREVRQDLLSRGLFQTSWWFYATTMATQALMFIAAILLTLSGDKLYLLGAVVMGMFWQQVAFIGHDVGHNAISHARSMDLFYGILFGNPLMGISLGWWKQSHNVHHVACNSVEHDPDIQHLPVFAVSKAVMEKPYWSTYHKKMFNIDFFARFLVANQHLLFYPVMALARFNLYAQSWINLIVQPHGPLPHRKLEMATLLAFFIWQGLLLSHLRSTTQIVLWVLVSHAVSGLLHVQICLSHFFMDTHRQGDPTRRPGFFGMQMQTSMDVITPEGLDWLHGGLQYQIEHHMFPRLPRHALRTARSLLLQKLPAEVFENKLYVEQGFFRANAELIRSMHRAATEARKLVRGDGGFYVSPLMHGLQLEG